MKNAVGKHIRLWKTLGFLGLFIALFFSYRLVTAGTSAGEVVEISVDGYETITNGTQENFAAQSDNTPHYQSRFRHTVRKRGLSRTNYLKRTVQSLSFEGELQKPVAGNAFLVYTWLYIRPSYYIHLFRYALF